MSEEFRPIDTAPMNEEVQVQAGEMTFHAMLVPDGAEDENGSYDQWYATRDGEHPPCWSEGGCWASNAEERPSLQPTGWRPVTPSPRTDEQERTP